MSTDHFAIVDAFGRSAASVVDGLAESVKLLDPKTAPATRLHKLFSIDVQTKNTNKYRDHRERAMRLDAEITLRVAWRLNPKDEGKTQRGALRDEDNVVRAVQTDARSPFPQVRIKYLRTKRQINPSREWLFADIAFSAEFDRSLTDDVT